MDQNINVKEEAKNFSRFKSRDQAVTTVPKLKDLYQHITPQYAADWKVIGTLLGLSSGKLKAIEAGYPTNVKWCCNQMLEKWLEVDPSASWEKIISVIESPAVSNNGQAVDKVTSFKLDFEKVIMTISCSTSDKGPDAISILSEIVSERYIQERFHNNCDGNIWPPDQPKHFVPLVLVSQQGQNIREQVTTLPQLIQTGDVDIDQILSVANNQSVPECQPKPGSHKPLKGILESSKVTKELTEILASLEQPTDPQFILIEGAPGIGKSFLLKEIAYRWGNEQILKTFKLVLLVPLRDPAVQQVSLVKELLQLFCNRGDTRDAEIATACSDYLVQNGGKDLTLLFDGFDEYPEALQKNSLIANIVKRKVLPYCALVVSSRPHVTVHLRDQATFTVDILGLPKIERNQFIQQALKDQPQKITEVIQYLEDHSSISSLCVVPFHMVVLLFLYKKGIPLPKNSTELYNHFICLTICRHLAKYGHPLDNTITNLSDLPDPYNKIIQQLSKFSLEAINNNRLIFSYDDIKAVCPDVVAIPGAINGFGILQVIQHFGLTGKTMTFNFLHFTIQEFLAAHHVASLSPSNELAILKEKFWSNFHFNMFTIYIALTKGQRPSFKEFIKPSLVQRFVGFLIGEQVVNRFVDDPVKCFHLFQCFFEAGDKEICRSIESARIFNEGWIRCHSHGTLSPCDVEHLTFSLLTHLIENGNIFLCIPAISKTMV